MPMSSLSHENTHTHHTKKSLAHFPTILCIAFYHQMDLLICMDTNVFLGPSCYNRRIELFPPPVFSSLTSPGLLSSIFISFPNIYAFSSIFTYSPIPLEVNCSQDSPSQCKTKTPWGSTSSLATPFPLDSHCLAPYSDHPLPLYPLCGFLPSCTCSGQGHQRLHLYQIDSSVFTSLCTELTLPIPHSPSMEDYMSLISGAGLSTLFCLSGWSFKPFFLLLSLFPYPLNITGPQRPFLFQSTYAPPLRDIILFHGFRYHLHTP